MICKYLTMANCNEKSADDLFPDKIFVKDNFTDFEKLLFAQSEIKRLVNECKVLRIELGELKSFVQELESNNKRTTEEKKELRAMSYNKALLEENKRLRIKNKKLKKDNDDLVYKLTIKNIKP